MSGIYIHIPFCHSKCFYCDFYSTPKLFDPMGYAEALKREFHLRHNEIDMPPGTIYLGGGTPSIFPEKALQAIFDFLPLENVEEMTIEVNPEDVTDRFARFLADSPVNRVSMGVQTMNDQELKAIGRRHSSYDTSKAIERLRHAGINNLSLDLIYGLPGQTIESWKQSLTSVLNLRPEHLSAYSLMLEPGTRLWAMKQAGRLPEVAEEDSELMYVMLCEMTRVSGFNHYEISNFSIPGFHSRHNSSYWDLTPYLGLGASAHSYDGSLRRANPSNLRDYLSADKSKAVIEDLTLDERIDEYLLIRLRTAEGLDMNRFRTMFGEKSAVIIKNKAEKHISNGMLESIGEKLIIPESKWLLTDSVLVDLFQS